MFAQTKCVLATALLLLSLPASAYYSTMDTGEVVPPKNYNFSLETQYVTDGNSGMNFVGRLDTGLDDDSSLRALLGMGVTDFEAGLFYKWVPYPDYGNQPAMGVLAGVTLAQHEGLNDLSIRVHPLISKEYNTEYGDVTAYGSLPVGMRAMEGTNTFNVQLQGGGQWKTLYFENILFLGEVGLNITETFTYISLGAKFFIDEEEGLLLN